MNDANPLLTVTPHPPFDAIRAEHAEAAISHILTQSTKALEELERHSEPTWAGLMQPLYELGEPITYAWGVVNHLLRVMNSKDWRKAHEKLQPDVVTFSLRAGQSQPIFTAVNMLRSGEQWDGLSEPRQRIVESALRGMRLAGVGLNSKKRKAFNEIQREVADLSTRFQNNLLDASKAFALTLTTRDEVAGLPDTLLAAAAQAALAAGQDQATPQAGPWRITLEVPIFVPFMKYAQRRDLREALYRAYVTRAAGGDLNNQPLIERILELRAKKAKLLGYGTPAEVSLVPKMADNVEQVDALHDRLREVAMSHAGADLAELKSYAADHGQVDPVMHWDLAYWAERLREKRFGFNDEDLRPYFQFPCVLEGLFALTETLFGVRVEAAEGDVPVWHPDVQFFRVMDHDGSARASFYLDPYSRPETKSGGAWMDPTYPRKRNGDGTVDLPVSYLVCNQTLPQESTPSLMTFREVETLFHEFGHALQHMLTTVEDPDAAGMNNIEWDAVELASQFMESWCYHNETIKALSKHIETGAELPDDLYRKITAARVFRSGSDTLRQVFFGMLDMELHHRFRPADGDSIASVKQRIASEATIMPPLPEDRFLCGFAHIFSGGYAAGYYSYKWAEVLSADAFGVFEEVGLDNREELRRIGQHYRDTILAMGGGKHPAEVFRLFRGRDPNPDALLRQLGLDRPPEESHS